MEQTVLNPVEIIAYAGLERNRQRRAKSRCVIRLDFESGRGLLCDTPRLYIEAGFDQLPMLYTQKHLLRAIRPKSEDDPHRHGLSVAQLKRLPELLAHPVMLCDSPAREDTLLALLRAVDCDNLPIIAAIRPNGPGYYELREIETNFIVTVYGKNNFSRYFDNLITPDKVIYYGAVRSGRPQAARRGDHDGCGRDGGDRRDRLRVHLHAHAEGHMEVRQRGRGACTGDELTAAIPCRGMHDLPAHPPHGGDTVRIREGFALLIDGVRFPQPFVTPGLPSFEDF